MALLPQPSSDLTADLIQMGFDRLATRPDADFFLGTGAADTFNGGFGTDSVFYHTSTAGVRIDLSDGMLEKSGFAARDALVSIENIIGSRYDDVIFGTSGANAIHGYDGNDSINGGGGNDTLFGGAGNDTLFGSTSQGLLTMDGGTGNDTLVASTTYQGRASIDGGSGNDTVKIMAKNGTYDVTTGTGRDLVEIDIQQRDFKIVITDFNPYWETAGNTVTAEESLLGDRVDIDFSQLIGLSVDRLSAHERIVDGDDLILRFTTGVVKGDVVFEDLGKRVDLVGGVFRVDFDFVREIEAV